MLTQRSPDLLGMAVEQNSRYHHTWVSIQTHMV